jgi:2-iminobutanoate/2-iminopropanoate deaminase
MTQHEPNDINSAASPRCINSKDAPQPVGPYCQAVVAGGFVFVSGQGGLDKNGNLVPGGVVPEARQAIGNIQAILKAAHPECSLRHVVRVTIYYSDIRDGPKVNEVYQQMFGFADGFKPARMVFQVASQPIPGAHISIDAQAVLP